MKVGAPLFALLAEGGHDAARGAEFDSAEISCSVSPALRQAQDRLLQGTRQRGAFVRGLSKRGQKSGPAAPKFQEKVSIWFGSKSCS